MSKKFFGGLSFTLLLASASLVRCVGDSTTPTDGGGADTTDPTGTAGHACFANQTCIGNLTCVSNVCVDLTPKDSGSDSAPIDSGADSPADVAADAPSDASDAATVQPILQWSFENNGNNTGSASGYNLTVTGATYVTGKFGKAAQFGSGAYANVTGMKNILGIYSKYTFSIWIYISAVNTNNGVFDFENRSSAPYGGFSLGYSIANTLSVCAASTTNSYLPSGSCNSLTGPAIGSWHNIIVSYAGTGTGAGQGAPLNVYVDDGTVQTVANDSNNNPIFSAGISDTLYVGAANFTLDEIRVYDTTFTKAEQCTTVIGGTWSGSACTLP